MTFRSTGVRVDGDNYVLDGTLTLRDITKPIALDLELGGFGPDPYGNTRVGFTATGELKRSDFGVDFNAVLETGGVVVGDKVDTPSRDRSRARRDEELIPMPAITVDDTLVLPRIPRPDPRSPRRDRSPMSSPPTVRPRAPGSPSGGPSQAACRWPSRTRSCCSTTSGRRSTHPTRPKGAPWHPHRGFETVSYILDGEIAHHDTNGGGGVIGEGDTQWMTAGAGILHDELPTERMYRNGGPSHAVQLWVNLPPALKMTPPRYQSITRDALRLLTSADGGALIRLIAGDIAGFAGPGVTHTPITYAHVTLAPGAEIAVPWNPAFNAMAYVLTGLGTAGPSAARSRAANWSSSTRATISSWRPPAGRPSRSTCCCWVGCRFAHRSPTTARS